MADFRRRTWIMRNRPSITPRIIDEEITPSSGWTDNPDFHCLLVDLPGFGKDDIKFNVNESGVIVVSGRKRIGEEKQVHFEKTFDVPENGDVKSLKMTFEGDTLKVVIPKVEKEKKDAPENMNGASSSGKAEEDKEAMALPASKDEEIKKDAPESLASSSENRQESKSPPSNDENRENITEEATKPAELSSDVMEEKRNDSEHEERKEEPEDKEEEFQSPKEEESRGKTNEFQEELNDSEEGKKSLDQKEGPQKTVIVKIIENRGIFLASIISFTLGVLLSQKFHTPSSK